jgi:hypothetical protein
MYAADTFQFKVHICHQSSGSGSELKDSVISLDPDPGRLASKVLSCFEELPVDVLS